MPSFIGHAFPGSYILIFGLWWTINQFRRFHLSRVANSSPYYNSPTFKVFFLPGRLANWELEGLFKMFVTFVMFVGELLMPGHPLPYGPGNGQHLTIQAVFFINGLTDILIYYKVPLPKSINYVSMALTTIVEGMLLIFHVYGRNGIDTSLHLLAAYSAIVGTLAVLVEMNFPASITAGLGRSYFTLLQGTWLWQVGYIIANPFPGDHTWDEHNDSHMMLLHLMFAWHLIAVFVVQLIIGGIMACIYLNSAQPKDDYRRLKSPLLQNAKGQEAILTVPTEDVNSDFE